MLELKEEPLERIHEHSAYIDGAHRVFGQSSQATFSFFLPVLPRPVVFAMSLRRRA